MAGEGARKSSAYLRSRKFQWLEGSKERGGWHDVREMSRAGLGKRLEVTARTLCYVCWDHQHF